MLVDEYAIVSGWVNGRNAFADEYATVRGWVRLVFALPGSVHGPKRIVVLETAI